MWVQPNFSTHRTICIQKMIAVILWFSHSVQRNFFMAGWYLWTYLKTDVTTKSVKMGSHLTTYIQFGLKCHSFSNLRTPYAYKKILHSIFDFMNQYYPNFDMMGWYLWSHLRTDATTNSEKLVAITLHISSWG